MPSQRANAAKFQNFKAETIVSDHGFKNLGGQLSHQKSWGEDVFSVYKKASINLDWTEQLKDECSRCGIDYLTTPYDLTMLDYLDEYVAAWKIGSGDIDWLEMIQALVNKNKPLIIATGAASFEEVQRAMKVAQQSIYPVVLMQCNTNYTGSLENFKYINLNVLSTYRANFPEAILGLSDHTPGHTTVLGAIVLGARVVEKHFTDDVSREGPDHKFSMDPHSWREMVKYSRELELALGDGIKKVEGNEIESKIVQRRALRASKDLPSGSILCKEDIVALRPCPEGGLAPSQISDLVGKSLLSDLRRGELIELSSIA